MKPRLKLIQWLALLSITVGRMLAGSVSSPDVPRLAIPPAETALPLTGFTGFGSLLVRNNRLDKLDWTEEQIAAFVEGVQAALRGKGYPLDEATRLVGTDMVRRIQRLGTAGTQQSSGAFAEPGKLEQYMKDVRKRYKMQQSDSGLLYLLKLIGRGTRPTLRDTVIVTLAGSGADDKGALPDISGENGKIKMTDMLPGLREGLQMMAVGSEAVFVLPPGLSFGSGEWPSGVEQGMPLTFIVTLHEVISPAGAP